jgi:tRNA 5-methylaminomethyl-2-thiouridine biosynthesis bifunctional protein
MEHDAFEPRPNIDQQAILNLKEHVLEMGFDGTQIQVLSLEEAYTLTNVRAPGIWFKEAAIYNLPKICETELNSVRCFWNCKIQSLIQIDGYWHLSIEENKEIAIAPVVILANSMGVAPLLKTIDYELILRPVRGQISTFQVKKHSPLAPFLPKMAIRGEGYCLPAKLIDDQFWVWSIGSSYDEDQAQIMIKPESHQENSLKGLSLVGCDHSLLGDMEVMDAYVGIRSASKDRLPLIGPIPNHKGLYIACAYGSRGVLWAALGSKLVSAYVDSFFAGVDRLRAGFLAGADSVLAAEVASSVNPARFFAGALATRASNSKPIFPDS